MIVDFQTHYTPPELMRTDAPRVQLDERGNPVYFLNPLLADLVSRLEMMDLCGIDAEVLSCGLGFDQPDVATCRLINDRMADVAKAHPGRFIGLAHVPALNPDEAVRELKRCAVELKFPGVVIASELQGRALDDAALRPFWKAVADLGLYAFIHPLPRVIGWDQVCVDDLGRMLGWEFSLMVSAVRLINSGLLDDLPPLRVQYAHFAGGLGRYLGRVRGLLQRQKWGTTEIPRHNRMPQKPFDYYMEQRLFFDCAGFSGPDHAGQWGAEWVGRGMTETAVTQTVFATDYPQALHAPDQVKAYVDAVRALGPNAREMMEGDTPLRLIPDLRQRIASRTGGTR